MQASYFIARKIGCALAPVVANRHRLTNGVSHAEPQRARVIPNTVGPIQAETIYRFKGQQAPAVILTDIVLSGEPEKRDRETALLWCGLTRAPVACELLVHEECGWLKAMQRASK